MTGTRLTKSNITLERIEKKKRQELNETKKNSLEAQFLMTALFKLPLLVDIISLLFLLLAPVFFLVMLLMCVLFDLLARFTVYTHMELYLWSLVKYKRFIWQLTKEFHSFYESKASCVETSHFVYSPGTQGIFFLAFVFSQLLCIKYTVYADFHVLSDAFVSY